MKSSTKLVVYGIIGLFLYKKLGTGAKMSGIDGLGSYPVPGSQVGYYSSQAYTSWYQNTFLPYYYRIYRTYPPAYLEYQQQMQGQANLYQIDPSTGQSVVGFDVPTPIQAPTAQQQYNYQYGQYPGYGYQQPYYQQQPYYGNFQYQQYQPAYSPYAANPYASNPSQQANTQLYPM